MTSVPLRFHHRFLNRNSPSNPTHGAPLTSAPSELDSWSQWLRDVRMPVWVRCIGAVVFIVGGLAYVGYGHYLLPLTLTWHAVLFYIGVSLVYGTPAVAFIVGVPRIRPLVTNIFLPLGLVLMAISLLV